MSAEGREYLLRQAIVSLADQYDYVLIDCPPSLGLLTLNTLTAADSVLIPIQCEFYALEGLGQLLQTIRRIQGGLNPALGVAGILLTMFDKRTNLSYQVAEDAENYFRDLVFKTVIPRNVRLSEAPSFGLPALAHDASSTGATRRIVPLHFSQRRTRRSTAGRWGSILATSMAARCARSSSPSTQIEWSHWTHSHTGRGTPHSRSRLTTQGSPGTSTAQTERASGSRGVAQ